LQFRELAQKRNVKADPSNIMAQKGGTKPWNVMFNNINIIVGFPRGDAMTTLRLIAGHG
jgi:hypothetical protein